MVFKEMEIIYSIRHILQENGIDAMVIEYWILSVIFIFIGGTLINANPPNFQVGYPMIAVGFAFFVFGSSHSASNISIQKTNEIIKKLDEIQEHLKLK
jgi:hypothetical protein